MHPQKSPPVSRRSDRETDAGSSHEMDPAALLHAHPPSDLATPLLPEDWTPSPSCCWALAPWAGDGLTPAPALCCHSLELLNTFLFWAEWHVGS